MKYAVLIVLCLLVALAVVIGASAKQDAARYSCIAAVMETDYKGGPNVVITCIQGANSWQYLTCSSASVVRSYDRVEVDCYQAPTPPEPTFNPYPGPEATQMPVRKIFRRKN